MVNRFLFKDRDGQTPLPPELSQGLKKKNIQTIGELDEYEEQNITSGLIWLKKQKKDCIDYAFWLQLHKKLFGNVWSWAGKIRTHELQNPDFLTVSELWTSIRSLEQDVSFWLENRTYSAKEIVARFHERLLTIHPFSNGNGRFSRIIVEFFCQQQGIPIPTWGAVLLSDHKKRRSTYIQAIVMARKQFLFGPLIAFIFDEEIT